MELEEQLEKLKTDRDALTIRLSKVVGEKLMKDNPYITDLSDKNRPTKLEEVHTELYYNEWTDAYEALTKSGYKDTEAIATLFKTLKSTVKVAANVLFQKFHEEMKDQKVSTYYAKLF
ncbi:hypothetical protein DPMN_059955 [Dreissena polymorpha]|uniref:Uncharacterized protein n=1 Tax=Dreissena polymorpha TaxID=45954 RepID=A0A9D4C4Q3_DREPO|nr:hypothetical protein DPMN_059955 [Dreissena polymorpha]